MCVQTGHGLACGAFSVSCKCQRDENVFIKSTYASMFNYSLLKNSTSKLHDDVLLAYSLQLCEVYYKFQSENCINVNPTPKKVSFNANARASE